MRKTTKMKNLLETANFMLLSPKLSQDVKKGVAMLIETALHESDSYRGFNNMKPTVISGGKTITSVFVGYQDEGYEEWTRMYHAPH